MDYLIQFTEDTKYIDWEDQPGEPKLPRSAIYLYTAIPSI